jgi:hypothetical protein
LNSDYDKILESQIDRELKALPAIKAPVELRAAVMAAIQPKGRARRSSWAVWPLGLQAATVVLLVAGFAGLCFIGWHLRQSDVLAVATRPFSEIVSWFDLFTGLVQTFASAIGLVFRNLNTALMAGLLGAAAFAYFTWIAIGALWFRIAFARR